MKLLNFFKALGITMCIGAGFLLLPILAAIGIMVIMAVVFGLIAWAIYHHYNEKS